MTHLEAIVTQPERLVEQSCRRAQKHGQHQHGHERTLASLDPPKYLGRHADGNNRREIIRQE
jgi:hypothetical protein